MATTPPRGPDTTAPVGLLPYSPGMVDLGPLVPVLFGAALLVVLIGGYLLEQKRRERLMQFAVRRGWTYVGQDPSLVDRWPGQPFGRGDRRRARNVLGGVEFGRSFTAYDYTYETRSTDSKGHQTKTTHRWSIVAVQLPVWLGTVEVVPESVLDRMAGAVGLVTDIELESEDFNRRYKVSARNRKLASDLLPPRTMEYLIAADAPGWRTCGSHVVAFAKGKVDPVEVVRVCAILDRVLDGVPEFVWKDAGAPGSQYSPEP
jgi:hypothetical protein